MSDTVTVAVISAVVTVITAWFGWRVQMLGRAVGQVHNLVNSAMTAQVRLVALSMRRIAILTRLPADEEAANVAEQALRDHMNKGK